MTISNQTIRAEYTASSGQTLFPYTWLIWANTDIAVYVNCVLQELTNDYTVSGVLNPSGGNVIFNSGLSLNDEVVLLSNVAYTQPETYLPNSNLPEQDIERAQDRNTRLTQQNKEKLRRALLFNPCSLFSDVELPDLQANSILQVQSDGTTLEWNNIEVAPTLREVFIATPGQTVFNLAGEYIPGLGHLQVVINGVWQAPSAYTETDEDTITLSVGAEAGDTVMFVIGPTEQVGVGAGSISSYKFPTGTSISRTVESRLAERFSVKDFGAVGDNITDDTIAIQKAIDYAESQNGGIVFFPAGFYYITGNLVIDNHYVQMEGVGVRSRIRIDNGFDILFVQDSNYVALRNLYFWVDGPTGVAILIDNAEYITLEHIFVDCSDAPDFGIWVKDTEAPHLLNTRVFLHDSQGGITIDNCNNAILSECAVIGEDNTDGIGIYITNSDATRLDGCHTISCQTGISLETTHNTYITSTYCKDNIYGIDADQADVLEISGCTFHSDPIPDALAGIHLEEGSGIHIGICDFVGTGDPADNYFFAGILLEANQYPTNVIIEAGSRLPTNNNVVNMLPYGSHHNIRNKDVEKFYSSNENKFILVDSSLLKNDFEVWAGAPSAPGNDTWTYTNYNATQESDAPVGTYSAETVNSGSTTSIEKTFVSFTGANYKAIQTNDVQVVFSIWAKYVGSPADIKLSILDGVFDNKNATYSLTNDWLEYSVTGKIISIGDQITVKVDAPTNPSTIRVAAPGLFFGTTVPKGVF